MPALAIIAAAAVIALTSILTGETDYSKMFDKAKQGFREYARNPDYYTK